MSSFDMTMTPALTTTTSGRPSWSTMLTHQARAQASFHLAALYALQPRFPPRHSSTYQQLEYQSLCARLHHRLLLLCAYAHVLATLFLDFSALYALVEVASHPDAGSGSSTAWWIASGIYAASFLTWFVGVVIIWEIVYLYNYQKAAINSAPSSASMSSSAKPGKKNSTTLVMPFYLSASAFTLTAIESLGKYSLLYKARFAASRRDKLIETFWFYSQSGSISISWLTLIARPQGKSMTKLD